MSEQTPPYPYFNGIIYNQSLFGGQSGQYLPRTGVATSVATSTTFNGIVYTSGLNDSSTISATNLSVSGTLTLPNNSIKDNYLSGNVDLLNLAQTISAIKTFSSPPIMSGSNITSASIPDTALSTNVALLAGTQTFGGAKTFTLAPTMSGSNITGTIQDRALSTNVALLSGTQTFGGAKTFSTRIGTNGILDTSTISGSNLNMTGTITLPANSIADSALSTNVALLTGTQTFSGIITSNSFVSSGYNTGSGYVDLQNPNQNDHTGFVEFKTNNGTRLGYIGYANYNNTTQLGTGTLQIYAENGTTAIEINKLSVSGTLTLPANSILDSALSTNVALLSGTQTFGGAKTFSSPPTMSGSNITGTIPDTSLTSNVALLSGTQTFGGAKTFSTRIGTNGILDTSTISGSNLNMTGTITLPANSIADSALSTNVALLTGSQTFSGVKTFSSTVNVSNSITPFYTTLPTFTSAQVGYTATASLGAGNYITGAFMNSIMSVTSLPIGVYSCYAYVNLGLSSPTTYIQGMFYVNGSSVSNFFFLNYASTYGSLHMTQTINITSASSTIAVYAQNIPTTSNGITYNGKLQITRIA
jgi:hypothetical protein